MGNLYAMEGKFIPIPNKGVEDFILKVLGAMCGR